VGAIEFFGPLALAAAGGRTVRNILALALASAGVIELANVSLEGDAVAFLFACANCALFTLYIVLAHRLAGSSGGGSVDRLAAAMLVAAVLAAPFGISEAMAAFSDWRVFAAAAGVAVSSSVIPYACDQMAMRRLPRASFALFLSLLPAVAAAVGIVVLAQWPSRSELVGIGLVIAAIALHRPLPR
jgi:inner membrane transporter RhtA